MRELIAANADERVVDKEKRTPLVAAAEAGAEEVVRFLLASSRAKGDERNTTPRSEQEPSSHVAIPRARGRTVYPPQLTPPPLQASIS